MERNSSKKEGSQREGGVLRVKLSHLGRIIYRHKATTIEIKTPTRWEVKESEVGCLG